MVDETVARFGRLDVAVNNAGTVGQPSPRRGSPRRSSDEASYITSHILNVDGGHTAN